MINLCYMKITKYHGKSLERSQRDEGKKCIHFTWLIKKYIILKHRKFNIFSLYKPELKLIFSLHFFWETMRKKIHFLVPIISLHFSSVSISLIFPLHVYSLMVVVDLPTQLRSLSIPSFSLSLSPEFCFHEWSHIHRLQDFGVQYCVSHILSFQQVLRLVILVRLQE